MSADGSLLHCVEATRFIEQIPDPVTRTLVNMAFVHLVKDVHLRGQGRPSQDLDMLFLVRSLGEFFSDHDVLARTLEGERVGAWFDEDEGQSPMPTGPLSAGGSADD